MMYCDSKDYLTALPHGRMWTENINEKLTLISAHTLATLSSF
jgi:hypothetical protein